MSNSTKKYSDFGLKAAIEAVSQLEGEARDRLIERIKQEDPELAKKLEDAQISFESLVHTNPTGFSVLLQKVEEKLLILSLRGASKELLERVFSSVSQRRALQLKESIVELGPQPKSKVEEARSQILDIAKEMVKEGSLLFMDDKKDRLV